MSNIIKIKRGLKANLPTLEVGEMGYCTDTNELFIGTANGNELINEDSTINALGDIGDVSITTPTADQALIYDGTNWVNDSPPAPSLPNQASISDETNTGSVTNTHTRQVNASTGSTASNFRSQVNASQNSTASGARSQVNVGENSTASGTISQVNAGSNLIASGTRSQANAGSNLTASGNSSQINASSSSIVSGQQSQVNASQRVINNVNYSVAGGVVIFASTSAANRKWHIFSETGNIQIAGTLSSNVNFSDFAELFPNATGKEQGYGLLQTLDGYGVRPAQEGERVFGVVSATAGILLNDTSFHWQGRYLVDEFGAKVMETFKDPNYKLESKATEEEKENGLYTIVKTEEEIPLIEVQKENPDYDIDREQISRKDRPDEWTVVGLIGQVYVRLNKDVKPGDSVKAWKDGIGQTSEVDTNIVVMKITQPYDSKKGYAIGFCLIK